MESALFAFVIDWQPENGSYRLWKLDPEDRNPLSASPVQTGRWETIGEGHRLLQIGSYILDWVPQDGSYRLWSFDPQRCDPLSSSPLRAGRWASITEDHELVPLGTYVLDWVPRNGTYRLWSFDPKSCDPLPWPPTQMGIWWNIGLGHRLVPLGNYVLDWVPQSGAYKLWSFDPQSCNPLSGSPVQSGTWTAKIGYGDDLVPLGDYVLAWAPHTGAYNLWRFDPTSEDPLPGPAVQTGTWSTIGSRDVLVDVLPRIPIQTRSPEPGTLDFMRTKIKHVVYYMLENRSFDHVCGWLYDNGVPARVLGADQGPFKGASLEYFNCDQIGQRCPVTQYTGTQLTCPTEGAFHAHSDVMKQLFEPCGEYDHHTPPPMTGFVLDNGTPQAMATYTPDKLPILNGLAKSYATSDSWFCSLPGPTDVNRAFSVTGSSFGRTVNFRSGQTYLDWPNTPHRPSMWKVMWSYGFDDWKIYHQTDWGNEGFCYTYHVFLEGQIHSVDEHRKRHVKKYGQFLKAARKGRLPAFSYLEPSWWGGIGGQPPNTYHPPHDMAQGEVTLNEVYDALLGGPQWEETLLIVTFDEHGGQYDHVPPPYGARPFPEEEAGEFQFDLLGVRVPTILISPWVAEQTVFRSMTSTPFDSTSMPATVLSWCGIPRARWGLGERTHHAPTFESAFTLETARTDKPAFTPPDSPANADIPLNDLHREFLPRLVWHIGQGKLSQGELQRTTEDMLRRATNIEELHALLCELEERCSTDTPCTP